MAHLKLEKSSLAYALIAECQRQGGIGILILAEGEYSTMNAHAYGVDESKLIILDTNVVEDVFETINEYLDQNPDIPLVFVIDSVAGLSTKPNLNQKHFDRSRNAQARALLFVRGISAYWCENPTDTTLSSCKSSEWGEINLGFKVKENLLVVSVSDFTHLYAFVWRWSRKIKKQRAGRKFVSGLVIRVTTDKNRLNSPFQTLDMIIDFEKGLRSKASKKWWRRVWRRLMIILIWSIVLIISLATLILGWRGSDDDQMFAFYFFLVPFNDIHSIRTPQNHVNFQHQIAKHITFNVRAKVVDI